MNEDPRPQPPMLDEPRFSSPTEQAALVPANDAQMMIRLKDSIMTAMAVQVPRRLERVQQNFALDCAANADRFMYEWEVNDRKRGRKVRIEGPTIKMANCAARHYGNNWTGIVHVERGEKYWILHAAFIDLETGFNLVRPFEQRVDQSMGMGDKARERDIVFQIAASKAIRNVVVNALDSLIEFGKDVMRRELLKWVGDPEKRAKIDTFITQVMERFDIDLKDVERVVGKKRDEWLPKDLVRVLLEMRSVNDEQIRAEDIYPPPDAGEPQVAEDKPKSTAEQKKPWTEPAAESAEKSPGASKPPSAKKSEAPKAEQQPEQPVETSTGDSQPPDDVDVEGEIFDPEVHAVDADGKPRKTQKGTWAKKRGRGAPKEQAKPAEPEQQSEAPPAEPEPQQQETLPPETEEQPKGNDNVFDLGVGDDFDFSGG